MNVIVFLMAQILKECLASNIDERLDIEGHFEIITVIHVDWLSIK